MELELRPCKSANASTPGIEDNKENVDPLLGNASSSVGRKRRSPLPLGFPRRPLQDITQALQSISNIFDVSDDEFPKKKQKLIAPSTKTESSDRSGCCLRKRRLIVLKKRPSSSSSSSSPSLRKSFR